MINRIGILGCGWLGLPLAKHLLELGFDVKGTTTSASKINELSAIGINPFLLDIDERRLNGNYEGFFRGLDLLIINIPPKLRKPPFENYVEKIKVLKIAIETYEIPLVLFASSISVYGEKHSEVTEKTTPEPSTESGRQLLQSERLLETCSSFKTTVVRLAGLIGPGRHPINQLAGRKNLTNGNDSINLIHLNDCLAVFEKIIADGLWGQTINAVYPYHPTKKAYYTEEALKRGLPRPYYLNSVEVGKKPRISSIFPSSSYKNPITS